ncbi:alpha-soluble NSF attachment protein [Striga asiatica]|uniref:Alpha-soluble NSF attachment protein n=1 Tax=Striga asiatica TaxID=4170 RepID=A0A5A7R6W2_STRAF|nr:alpha-soluble NSF attachment protein [Striga asiatica]
MSRFLDSLYHAWKSLDLFVDIGRLNMRARYYKEIAELYEQEQNLEQAIVYYDKAADLFQSEDMTTSAYQCKQKVAQYAAQLEQEKSKHLLNAGICQLCKNDIVAINNALGQYQDLDPTFSGTLKDFDSMTQPDAWKTTLLLRVKEALKAKELQEDDLT